MHLIALDAGTTGISAVLYDERLTAVASATKDLTQWYPRPGWVEHDGAELVRAADQVLGELAAHPAAAGAIAVGLTNQRETVFALDRTTGEPLCRGIVWQDRRTAPRCAQLRSDGEADWLAAHTGLFPDPYFSATKIEWMLQNHPEVAERARRGQVVFATVDTLLRQHLTQDRRWLTDPTNASRTLLFHIDDRSWDERACALFSIEPDWLAEVLPSSGDFGRLHPRYFGREIAICGIAGDQQAALFGQGCFARGEGKATYGTGLFVLVQAGATRPRASGGLLVTLAVDERGAPSYALEGSAFQGGSILQWLRDELGILESAAQSEALAESVPDSQGVTFVPAFTGLGAPYWNPDARGALLGLTRGTTRAHIARAALEAIAFQVAELVELFRAGTGGPMERLAVDGGAAANNLLMGIQADLLGVNVERPSDVEATARGAAMLAGVGAGLWASGRAVFGQEFRRFAPRLGASERAERLAAWRAAVRRVL